MGSTVHPDEMRRIVESDHFDPFRVLGGHEIEAEGARGLAIRAFRPEARRVSALVPRTDGTGVDEVELERTHPDGFFETFLPGRTFVRYRLRVEDFAGNRWECWDPYTFLPLLSDFDIYLFSEGTQYQAFDKMGAHIREVDGIRGVHFAVWAPEARRVSVVGEFNQWDGRRHQMRMLGASGVWEIFIPDLPEFTLYKYEIRARDGFCREKADPYGFCHEPPPGTASVVYDMGRFEWSEEDAEWIARRDEAPRLDEPVSIYEVHLGSWMRIPEEGNRPLSYLEIAGPLADYVQEMGFTHVELLPVAEHPFGGSWGYQVTGYYAPTRRWGWPHEFAAFVDYMHRRGIGVILDWVPAHFPKDPHSLARFDGSCLYEHEHPFKGEHKDWGTLIFNYGRHEVKNFLISNALFWIEKYHVDGLRVDAVASMLYLDYSRKEGEWIPNQYGGKENLEAIEFLRKMNEVVCTRHPGVYTIAEESTAWPMVSRPTYIGGLGFTMKWNMGWMHDVLEYFSMDPIYRQYHQDKLTFALMYAFTENFVLVLSHDEVVHGKGSMINKMPGDWWQKFANLRALYTFMWGFPGKKLLFMGSEFGQWREWNHDDSLDWHLLETGIHHEGLRKLVRDLNRLYTSEPAMHEKDFDWRGFQWIDFDDSLHSVVSFYRRRDENDEQPVVFVFNFTPVPRENYKIGVPVGGVYREFLNTDSEIYGGTNLGNGGTVRSEDIPWQGFPFSLTLTLPPLAGLVLKPISGREESVSSESGEETSEQAEG